VTFDFRAEVELQDALRIGRVVEVVGRSVRVQVDENKNSAYASFRGELIKGVAVGTFVRILKGPMEIVGRVEGEFMTETKRGTKLPDDSDGLNRFLTLAVIGKFGRDGSFFGGVNELPLISNVAYLLAPRQVDRLFAFVGSDEVSMPIGTFAEDQSQTLLVSSDRLLASHVGIFGNTGSGKSNTLAFLLASVAKKYGRSRGFRRNASFLVLDFNGEYLSRPELERYPISADSRVKRDIDLGNANSDFPRVPLPLSAMLDAELWAVLLEATPKTQLPLIRRAFKNRRIDSALQELGGLQRLVVQTLLDMTREYNSSIERNSPVAFLESLQTVFETSDSALEDAIESLRSFLILNTTTQTFYAVPPGVGRIFADQSEFEVWIEGIADIPILDPSELSSVKLVMLRIILQFHIEVARGYANREFLSPLLKRLETRIDDLDAVIEFAAPTPGPPITVVAMDKLSADMQRVIGVLVARFAFDSHLKSRRSNPNLYLAIVVDEAHHVLTRESSNESEQWRDYRLSVFESIVKEGRKFGAFLLVSSQRPSDISPTVLSQLHNYFIHRLVNVKDIEAIERLVPYLDKVSFEQIPLLPPGEAVVTGSIVERPVVVAVRRLKFRFRPMSETLKPTSHW